MRGLPLVQIDEGPCQDILCGDGRESAWVSGTDRGARRPAGRVEHYGATGVVSGAEAIRQYVHGPRGEVGEIAKESGRGPECQHAGDGVEVEGFGVGVVGVEE